MEPRAGGEREREVPNCQCADWRYSEATESLRGSSDDAASRAVWSQPLKGV